MNMGKPVIKIIVAVNMTLVSPFTWAQSTGVETRGSTVSTPSVKDASDQSGSANKGAAAQQAIMGAMMFAMSAAQIPPCSTPGGQAHCALAALFAALGALSMAQSGNHKNAAQSAGVTGSQSDGYGTNPYQYNDPTLDNLVKNDPSVKAMGENLKKLTASGIYDPKTGKIKTPDGKLHDASDFASKGGMAGSGLPGGAIDSAIAAYSAVEKKASEKVKMGAMTASNGYDEGGGGGKGSGSGDGSPAEDGSSSALAAGAGKVGLDRDPSSLAGMQKNYNGEPIGVAADSIFLMMARRYKVKESQESFYSDRDLALQNGGLSK